MRVGLNERFDPQVASMTSFSAASLNSVKPVTGIVQFDNVAHLSEPS